LNTGAPDGRVRLIADDLVSIAADDPADAQRTAEHLRTDRWVEVVPGLDSVVVQFDSVLISPAEAVRLVAAGLGGARARAAPSAGIRTLHVRYGGDDGPDLRELCRRLGLSRAEFLERHTGADYRVDMLGFTPGFAYLGGLDPRLDAPRLGTPRQRVPAGSVGVAGGRTGVYALPGPGGWSLVGRVDERLFDAAADEPFLLSPGMRVRLVAVPDGR
jgi:KipI family sensor histidine kinase inhibitor